MDHQRIGPPVPYSKIDEYVARMARTNGSNDGNATASSSTANSTDDLNSSDIDYTGNSTDSLDSLAATTSVWWIPIAYLVLGTIAWLRH